MRSFSRFARLISFFCVGWAFAVEIPPLPLARAKKYLVEHAKEFPNQNYLSVIDYGQPSSAKRFYILNVKTQTTEAYLVAHGRGSDPQHTGRATKFGDEPRSLKTSLGFFKTGSNYVGSHGESMHLIGLSSTNRNAESRAIVLHGAPYVAAGRAVLGRSWGCPAVDPQDLLSIRSKISGGSLILAWHPRLAER